MMYIRVNFITLCLLIVHAARTEAGDIIRDTYCYGDSSNGNNLLDITCSPRLIKIHDIITATKPLLLGCPADDHDYTPALADTCCTYNATDCMSSYTGDTTSYHNCTGSSTCRGIPIVRQRSGCDSTTHPTFTNYLIVEYSCVSHGLLNGACATTANCIINDTVCSNTICLCRTGYSEFENTCIEDGIPNGGCMSDGSCNDNNAYCSPETSRCTCRSGYTEDKQRCIKVSSLVQRPGFCHGDSSYFSNLINVTCFSGVIYVKDVLTGAKPTSYSCPDTDNTYTPSEQAKCCNANDSTDCIMPFTGTADAYFACSGKKHCGGIPVVRQQNACDGPVDYPRFSNYLIIEYVCVPEGQIHGSCDASTACVDRNSECYDSLCRCVNGFSDQDHVCWEDGTPGVECLPDNTCVDPHANCDDNTCMCTDGYTRLDGACVKSCTTSTDCTRSFTECTEGVCVCLTDYSFVYGVCKEDEEVGGLCSFGGTCWDANATCAANNVCQCIGGYSYVVDTCKQDGSVGGICGSSSSIQCTDGHSECLPSQNGVCTCRTGYQDVSGVCKQDGCVGCTCQTNGDCMGTNSECGTDLTCLCTDGYSEVGAVCQQDGEVGGICLPDNTCYDVHAICITGKCQCNDVNHYTYVAGTCVREDGFLNGHCNSTLPCRDHNSYCVKETMRCVCNNNYWEVNGICELGNTSSVTSCTGSSPYNTLVPDCDRDSFPVEIRSYNRSKRMPMGCQQNVDTYNRTYYLSCCTADQDDCQEDQIGKGNCLSIYFTVTEYVCLNNQQVIDADTDDDTNGTDVGVSIGEGQDVTGITNSSIVSTYNCSVQASCLTAMDVFVLRNTLQKVIGLCSCNISIIGDGSTRSVTCDDPVADHYNSIKTVTGGFVHVHIEYRGRIRGGFTFLFKAVDRNAILTATCGLGAKPTGITNLDRCRESGSDDEGIIEINDDGDEMGPEVGIVTPGYNDIPPDWNTEPSDYECSIQASCTTDIAVFVLVNTLEKVNNVCSCNISIVSNEETSAEVTCDRPRPSYYTRIFTASTYSRVGIQYHDSIKGHFLILFRALQRNAFLTVSCGKSAKLQENLMISTCSEIGTGDDSIECDDDDDTDGGGSVVDITNPGQAPAIGSDIVTYHCSIQASCVTQIQVFVMLNTLLEVNDVCLCNITVYGDATPPTDVNCDGPTANRRTPILNINDGFSRVDINYGRNIRGSFIIRFQALNNRAKLIASCGDKAKQFGIPNLPLCSYNSTDGTSIEADDDDECSGSHCIVVSPDYPNDVIDSTQNGLSVYQCSVQASCTTSIDVFVIHNTLQKNNGLCFCNITLNADYTSTDVTCDGPAANHYAPIMTVVNGYINMEIHYSGTIYGRFAILFTAVDKFAKLTAACGSNVQPVGIQDLGTCNTYGNSVEVHNNETRNDTDVSIAIPGYGGGVGSVPSISGGTLYRCSVHASCLTTINVFVVLNTLQKTGNICSCNITLTSHGSSVDVTCDGPAQNRFTPILSTPNGFVLTEIDYESTIQGHFVIEFRAVERNAILTVGCGTKAIQAGLSNLEACPGKNESTIEIDDNEIIVDTEVSIENPSNSVQGTYECSVQMSCRTAVDVFVTSNALEMVNGVGSCNISITGSEAATQVTCDGPGSNPSTAIFTEPSGFLRVRVTYVNGVQGHFKLTFKGQDDRLMVNASCGTFALVGEWPELDNCGDLPESGKSTGSNLLLVIIIVVVAGLLICIIAILCWVFRRKVRAKLCPQKGKISLEPVEPMAIGVKPIIAGPGPMNTKFPGRDPADGKKQNRHLTRMKSNLNMVDYLSKEVMDNEKNTNPEIKPTSVFMKERDDTVVRSKFKRRLTLKDELMKTAELNEKIEKENEKQNENKTKKKLKKMQKQLRKARVGITAAKAFELPKTYNNESSGTYLSLRDDGIPYDDFHPPGLYTNQSMGAPPPLPFIQGGFSSSNHFMPNNSGKLVGPGIPNFTAPGFETDHPRPLGHAQVRLPPLPFKPVSAWKRAGHVAGVVGQSVVKRKKTLDISSVDSPGEVQHSELEY